MPSTQSPVLIVTLVKKYWWILVAALALIFGLYQCSTDKKTGLSNAPQSVDSSAVRPDTVGIPLPSIGALTIDTYSHDQDGTIIYQNWRIDSVLSDSSRFNPKTIITDSVQKLDSFIVQRGISFPQGLRKGDSLLATFHSSNLDLNFQVFHTQMPPEVFGPNPDQDRSDKEDPAQDLNHFLTHNFLVRSSLSTDAGLSVGAGYELGVFSRAGRLAVKVNYSPFAPENHSKVQATGEVEVLF